MMKSFHVSSVVLLSREMRASGVNLILTVLAMADLCLLYTGLLRNWVLFVSRGGLDLRAINIHTFRIHMFLTFLARELSSMTLTVMTIERVISVCAPLRAREWCSRWTTIKALAGMITILAGMNITTLYRLRLTTVLQQKGKMFLQRPGCHDFLHYKYSINFLLSVYDNLLWKWPHHLQADVSSEKESF